MEMLSNERGALASVDFQRPMPRLRTLLLAAACFLLAVATPAPAGPPPQPPTETYLALGDSVAFGYTTAADSPPSLGDQGYVRPFADWLATQHGGVRPYVLNLSVPAETAQSFFHGGGLGEFLNQNYTRPPAQKQFQLMVQQVRRARQMGRPVTTVTVQLGANDMMRLLTPEFAQQSAAEQQRRVHSALRKLGAAEHRLLHRLHALLPHAKLYLMGYYDPLEALPRDPHAAGFRTFLPELNGTLSAEAGKFRARFVDLSPVFAGHEGEWTYITQLGYPAGIHPNAAGYAAIAGALEQK